MQAAPTALSWIPDIAGKYTVTATFTGTNSYYSSYAETAFVAGNIRNAYSNTNPVYRR